MTKDIFVDLVVENSKSGSTIPFYQFMFRNISILESLNYLDWLFILGKMRNSPLSLYNFLPFMYKFIGIDLVGEFHSLEEVSLETGNYIKDSLEGNYCFLCLTPIDASILKSQGNLINRLLDLKVRLISQGAVGVEKVLYTGNEPPILIGLEEIL